MKKILLGSVALIVMSAPVLAADMPVKVKPLPPAWSWNGCYIGLNVGYAWAKFRKSEVTTVNPGGTFFQDDFDFDDDGALGGAQAGCNWQYGQTVFGIETDIQVTSIDARRHFDNAIFNTPVALGILDTDVRSALRWFGTVRGRLGWTVTPTTLLYVTGGFAYGHVQSSLFFPAAAGGNFGGNFDSQTHFGWTVGVGGEAKIAQNFTAKLEYLCVDLGSQDYTFNTAPGFVTWSWKQQVDMHVVRLGLNYQFDWWTPVVAKY
jgi:outer membrane immunogenic protein